jgi:hypothetical protein
VHPFPFGIEWRHVGNLRLATVRVFTLWKPENAKTSVLFFRNLVVEAHTCNPRTQEVDARGS